jgi:hypothetical protein
VEQFKVTLGLILALNKSQAPRHGYDEKNMAFNFEFSDQKSTSLAPEWPLSVLHSDSMLTPLLQ